MSSLRYASKKSIQKLIREINRIQHRNGKEELAMVYTKEDSQSQKLLT